VGFWHEIEEKFCILSNLVDVEIYGIVLGLTPDGKIRVYWQETKESGLHYPEEIEVVLQKG
jgi:hypothetical protein